MDAVRDRYPDSPVDYREGDLLDLRDSPTCVGAFDLVVEIYTLQALHPSLRERGDRRRPRPDGARGPRRSWSRSSAATTSPSPPSRPGRSPRAEMEAVAGDGVELESLDEVLPPGRVNPLWRMELTRR